MARGAPRDNAAAPDNQDRAPANNLPGDLEGHGAPGETLTPKNCAKCRHHGENVWQKLYSLPGEGVEEAHGPAGRFVKKLGLFGYALFFLIPLAFVAIVYAIIPLGDPRVDSFREQWVFVFVANPAVVALFCFLYTAAFLMCAGRERPFRQHIFPLAFVSIVQIAFLAPVSLLHGVFDYLGVVTYTLFLISLYIGLKFSYRDLWPELDSFFRRFVFLIAVYVPMLVGYLIAYRESGSLGQTGLSLALALVTFLYRRIMLSKLDPFPLEIAQLLSGLWVQNMSDVMQIFAFPQVDSPGVLVGTFLFNAIGNLAFLGFISELWIMKLRPNIKNAVLNGIKGNCPLPPIPEPDFSFDPHDRGHSANVNGYRRRQFRFFFFRLLSQAVAVLLYLGISPMLRFGVNRDLTPLSKSNVIVDNDQFGNSLIYAAITFGAIIIVLVFGYQLLRKRHHQSFHELREIHVHDLQNQSRVGLIIAIITHNLIFAIATIISPYCVFSGFRSCVFDAGFN